MSQSRLLDPFGKKSREAATSRLRENLGLTAKLDRLRSWHLMGARRVRGSIRGAVVRYHHFVGEEVGFDFFAADIGEHMTVDFDAWAQHLTAFFNHLLPLGRFIDDVSIFVRKIIFAQDGPDALAPSASRFQVSNDLRFIHRKSALKLPYEIDLAIISSIPHSFTATAQYYPVADWL